MCTLSGTIDGKEFVIHMDEFDCEEEEDEFFAEYGYCPGPETVIRMAIARQQKHKRLTTAPASEPVPEPVPASK
jgi:hypothetical protein